MGIGLLWKSNTRRSCLCKNSLAGFSASDWQVQKGPLHPSWQTDQEIGDENGEEAWHLSRVAVHWWSLLGPWKELLSRYLLSAPQTHPRCVCWGLARGVPPYLRQLPGWAQRQHCLSLFSGLSSPKFPPTPTPSSPYTNLILLFSSTIELNTPSKPEPTSLGTAFHLLVVGRTGFPNIVQKRGEIFVLCMGSWEEGNPPGWIGLICQSNH